MFRIGLGFDSHAFEDKKNKPLKLGGVEIPSDVSLKGHSDADVLLHAITDALLGAISAPDIGQLFPPDNPTWKDADSSIFLLEALKLVKESGYKIGNLDCVIICDIPKIAPYKKKIIQNLAELLKIHESRISVKGKTTEGFIEKNKGITVICNVLLTKA